MDDLQQVLYEVKILSSWSSWEGVGRTSPGVSHVLAKPAVDILLVPKMEVLIHISCVDTAYVRENPTPKIALEGSVPPL